MATRVELIFDIVSPNAYLIWWPLREIINRTEAELACGVATPRRNATASYCSTNRAHTLTRAAPLTRSRFARDRSSSAL